MLTPRRVCAKRNLVLCPRENDVDLTVKRCFRLREKRCCVLRTQTQKRNTATRSFFFVLALPIFPVSHPTSIFGGDELNFCVRYGNRWTLTPISTNSSGQTSYRSFPGKPEKSLISLSFLSSRIRFRWFALGRGIQFSELYPENRTLYGTWLWKGDCLHSEIVGQALGLLVSVSLTHYCAYTPDLSTSSSTTCLTPERMRDLILGRVSRLDAFSVYLVHT